MARRPSIAGRSPCRRNDARTGKEYPLGGASKRMIHAFGGKVLYAEKPGESGSEGVFSADIVVPKALQ